jgi:anthranilate phosphoribosyltransferase
VISTANSPAAPFAHRLREVVHGNDLDERDAGSLLGEFMDGNASGIQAAALLSALATKGETVSEVVGAAKAMRSRSVRVRHGLPLVMDLCGTGGDHRNTLNISTMASLVVAAAGVPVAKHGNRAASSLCGSADVLEQAGLEISIDPAAASDRLRSNGFTFMFAQLYHPAMKNVAPVRRELPIRTIFNVLGPLTNPAAATHQVVGVARPSHVELVGRALQALGTRSAAVVHAANGIDEVAGDCPTSVFSFDDSEVRQWTIDPQEYGVSTPLCEIQGGSPEYNAAAFERILKGERSGRSGVVALNAALALQIAGRAADLHAGMRAATDVLESGAAYELFRDVRYAA